MKRRPGIQEVCVIDRGAAQWAWGSPPLLSHPSPTMGGGGTMGGKGDGSRKMAAALAAAALAALSGSGGSRQGAAPTASFPALLLLLLQLAVLSSLRESRRVFSIVLGAGELGEAEGNEANAGGRRGFFLRGDPLPS